MPKEIDLRAIKVESDLLGDTLQPSRITLVAQCGEPARVELDVNVVTNEKIQSQGEEDLAAVLMLNKTYQEKAFSEEASKARISLIDNTLGDDSNTLEFNGFISAPGFQIAPGSFGAQVSAIHEDVRMESFNPSVYAIAPAQFGTSFKSTVDAEFTKRLQGAGRTKSVAEHIKYLLESSVSSDKLVSLNNAAAIQAYSGKGAANNAKKHYLNIHQANKKEVDYITEFLNRSPNTVIQVDQNEGNTVDNVPLFTELQADDIAVLMQYKNWMQNSYTGSKNFLNYILSTVCPNFLFEYVCNMDGHSYIQHPQVNGLETEEAEIEALSINFSLAARYQKSIGQVVTFGPGNASWGDGALNQGLHMGAYPNPPAPDTGKFISTNMPPWFHHTTHFQDFNYIAVTDGHRDPDGVADADLQKLQDITDVSGLKDAGSNFYKVWSQKQYYLWALKNTAATFEIPLNVEWGTLNKPLGARYTVAVTSTDGGATKMVRGYLNRVVHHVQTNASGATGLAKTSLEFTHIKTPGFELPG